MMSTQKEIGRRKKFETALAISMTDDHTLYQPADIAKLLYHPKNERQAYLALTSALSKRSTYNGVLSSQPDNVDESGKVIGPYKKWYGKTWKSILREKDLAMLAAYQEDKNSSDVVPCPVKRVRLRPVILALAPKAMPKPRRNALSTMGNQDESPKAAPLRRLPLDTIEEQHQTKAPQMTPKPVPLPVIRVRRTRGPFAIVLTVLGFCGFLLGLVLVNVYLNKERFSGFGQGKEQLSVEPYSVKEQLQAEMNGRISVPAPTWGRPNHTPPRLKQATTPGSSMDQTSKPIYSAIFHALPPPLF